MAKEYKIVPKIRKDFQDFAGVSGVYCIKNQCGEVLYVGQSKNLRERLATHARNIENVYRFHKSLPYKGTNKKYYYLAKVLENGGNIFFEILWTLDNPPSNEKQHEAILLHKEAEYITFYNPRLNIDVPESVKEYRKKNSRITKMWF